MRASLLNRDFPQLRREFSGSRRANTGENRDGTSCLTPVPNFWSACGWNEGSGEWTRGKKWHAPYPSANFLFQPHTVRRGMAAVVQTQFPEFSSMISCSSNHIWRSNTRYRSHGGNRQLLHVSNAVLVALRHKLMWMPFGLRFDETTEQPSAQDRKTQH